MDYSRKLSILVVSSFLLMSGIQGQRDGDSTEICGFCHMDGLLDCNLAEMIQVNKTVNCNLSDRMCTLGIDQSFEDFDNLTMQEISKDWICLVKEVSITTSTPTVTAGFEHLKTAIEGTFIMSSSIPTITGQTEGYLKTTMEETLVEPTTDLGSLDYQNDQPTEIMRPFRSDAGPDSTKDQKPPLEGKFTCFMCDSSSDEACLNKVANVKTVECPDANGCMSVYSGGSLLRNCMRSLSPEEVSLCQNPANKTCVVCTEANCNKKSWQQCHQCNSKDDSKCAIWSHPESIPVATCPNYDDHCSVRITTDGDTVRECAPAETKCPPDERCATCQEPLCNHGVFPEDRRRCIQCQECEDAQDPSTAQPCARYHPKEECYMYVSATSKMFRGCVSNTTEMLECKSNAPKCITCADENGCNSAPLMKDPRLSCSKCNSKDNPTCALAQPPTSVVKCEKKLLYYLQETCMTEFDPATSIAVRDCSSDYGMCIPEDQNCVSCSGDGCNRGNLKVQECIQCNGGVADQITCNSRAEGIPPTKCPQEVQTYQMKGCYSMTKGNITTRGCIEALSDDDYKFCKSEGKSDCHLCVEDGCNNLLAPSSGLRTGQISIFAVIAAIFITV